jgi:hypothetical protein
LAAKRLQTQAVGGEFRQKSTAFVAVPLTVVDLGTHASERGCLGLVRATNLQAIPASNFAATHRHQAEG